MNMENAKRNRKGRGRGIICTISALVMLLTVTGCGSPQYNGPSKEKLLPSDKADNTIIAVLTDGKAKTDHTARSADTAELAHNFIITALERATCTEKGMERHTCTSCGYTTVVETIADGHDLQLEETYLPSCTTNGYNVYRCLFCSYHETEMILSAGHNMTAWEPVDDGREGTYWRYCKQCGERQETVSEIEKTNETTEDYNGSMSAIYTAHGIELIDECHNCLTKGDTVCSTQQKTTCRNACCVTQCN